MTLNLNGSDFFCRFGRFSSLFFQLNQLENEYEAFNRFHKAKGTTEKINLFTFYREQHPLSFECNNKIFILIFNVFVGKSVGGSKSKSKTRGKN